MRLAHKRKVQSKLQKRIKATFNPTIAAAKVEAPVAKMAVKEAAAKEVADTQPAAATNVALTPKQKQILQIVATQPEGMNTKSIGVEAGQEEAKAASWATGGLKKLVEENLVEKVQLGGNKVIYKAL